MCEDVDVPYRYIWPDLKMFEVTHCTLAMVFVCKKRWSTQSHTYMHTIHTCIAHAL